MTKSSEDNSRGHWGGCLSFIVAILTLWSLWFGLSTPWGKFHIDMFPPAVRLEVNQP